MRRADAPMASAARTPAQPHPQHNPNKNCNVHLEHPGAEPRMPSPPRASPAAWCVACCVCVCACVRVCADWGPGRSQVTEPTPSQTPAQHHLFMRVEGRGQGDGRQAGQRPGKLAALTLDQKSNPTSGARVSTRVFGAFHPVLRRLLTFYSVNRIVRTALRCLRPPRGPGTPCTGRPSATGARGGRQPCVAACTRLWRGGARCGGGTEAVRVCSRV